MVKQGRKFRMHKKAFVAAFSIGCILLLGGCTPTPPFVPDTTDTTPPVFSEVLVELQSGNPPAAGADFGIITGDLNQSGITGIRLIGANDPPTTRANLTWKCSLDPNPETTGNAASMDLLTVVPGPSAPTASWSLDTVIDPIGAITGPTNTTNLCVTSPNGAGPWNILGYVRVLAINGAGLTVMSGSFLYDYADVGTPQ
jgi:hypothetical protein